MILHAPLALLAALFVVTLEVAAPEDGLEPQNLGLTMTADQLVTMVSLSR